MLGVSKIRTFEKTHPWITFELDLRKADHELWLMLGEAVSKCEHISGVPLKPDTAHKLHMIYLAKGIMATTAIEGNTLSEEEVLDRLEGRLQLPPSREYLGKEVDNILNGYNLIIDRLAAGSHSETSINEICEYNKLVLQNLTHEEHIIPGKIRTYSVGVPGYRGAPAKDCEFLLAKLCDWLNSSTFSDSISTTALAILKSIIAHLYIAWIHPFGDGNGRAARMLELKILLSSGVPAPAAHLLSDHYNLTRAEYYRQLVVSSKSGGNVMPFIKYALQGFVDELKSQIDAIRKQHFEVAWRDYVHEQFRDKTGAVSDRRRCVVLDLTKLKEPVPLTRIRELSPQLAEFYSGKTLRTIRRDVAELVKMDLVKWDHAGISANSSIVLSFLPFRKNND